MMKEEDRGSETHITMWTTQTKPVMDTLSRDGISYVKKQYVTEKYGDTAWMFF